MHKKFIRCNQGYKKVQGNAAYCWQQPRHDPQKKLKASVVEEYGSSEEGTSQWAQQARGSGGQGQRLSSVLKGNIKSNSLKSHLKQQESDYVTKSLMCRLSLTALRSAGNLEVQEMTKDSSPSV